MKNSITSGLLVLAVTASIAQDRTNYYTNVLNPFLQNAAYTGANDNTTIILNAKSMLGNVSGLNKNVMFGIHTAMPDNTGIGLKVIADYKGAMQNVNAEFSCSKKIQLAEEHFLSFGASAGVTQTTLRSQMLTEYVDLSDPTIGQGGFSKLHFTAGAGLLYKWTKGLDVALSAPTLVTSGERINTLMIGQAAYTIKLSADEAWKLKPNATVYKFNTSKTLIDGGVGLSWKDNIWTNIAYRSNSSMIFALGYQVKSFAVSYAYNMNFAKTNTLSGGTNEIALTFGFNKINKRPRVTVIDNTNKNIVEEKLAVIKTRLEGLIQVEKTNPGMVNAKKEIKDINNDFHRLLRDYKVDNVESIKNKVAEIQGMIDGLITKYSSKQN